MSRKSNEGPDNPIQVFPGSSDSVVMNYNGVDIPVDESRMISLTEIWRACGSDESLRPAAWKRLPVAKKFIDRLRERSNVRESHIWVSRRGKHGGGVWAHWQVAMAYAKHLSPEFHQLVNEAFRQYAREHQDPQLKAERAVDGFRRKGKSDEWIGERMLGIVARKAFSSGLSRRGVRDKGFSDATNAINLRVIGKTASDFKKEHGAPKSSSARDYFTPLQLAATRLAEILAIEKIERDGAVGNEECVKRCEYIGDCIRVTLERGKM